jgi:hypothetical protein
MLEDLSKVASLGTSSKPDLPLLLGTFSNLDFLGLGEFFHT